ncbi:MAG: carboxymuconolactone decarboxylase family protein [Lentisphaerae bacterium]|nr:carboxymuconolactone decarboxylase family protein [Lentisphaerota bacterium]
MKNKTVKSCVATPQVIELVAIGASIASNCEPCFKYHFTQAQKIGVSKEDIANAVATAEMVKNAPDREIKKLARKYLGYIKVKKIVMAPCCFSSSKSECCG